ncbi:uncharacterized protein BO80DRAFT_292281 [Aspergillus ibericus CBS 121593]|uniref:Uncharacterized protein n=1 Tax=Aspergillus ibericus CBS 121593 TaxID=1448316 RepID=A0A395GHL2_9EURO|nr:hypothetical protein BO80DRAFT_292281 [Aspergillus ibericus CBS 121593]RAK94895.1 hypothetical protein BO80DRAFT_292281 [Aspergillus ibericus CBS 121593]
MKRRGGTEGINIGKGEEERGGIGKGEGEKGGEREEGVRDSEEKVERKKGKSKKGGAGRRGSRKGSHPAKQHWRDSGQCSDQPITHEPRAIRCSSEGQEVGKTVKMDGWRRRRKDEGCADSFHDFLRPGVPCLRPGWPHGFSHARRRPYRDEDASAFFVSSFANCQSPATRLTAGDGGG